MPHDLCMLPPVMADARRTALRAVSDALLALRRLERTSTSGRRAACGVTPAQGTLVHEVALGGEAGSTASRLASRLGISVSAVTQLIDGLAEAGILERRRDPNDGRRTRVVMTGHGRRLYARFDEARLAQAEAFLRELDDEEVRTLARLLSKATHD